MNLHAVRAAAARVRSADVVARVVALCLLAQLAASASLWFGDGWLAPLWVVPMPLWCARAGTTLLALAGAAVLAGLGGRRAIGTLAIVLMWRCAIDRALWQTYALEHVALLSIAAWASSTTSRDAEGARAVRWVLGLVFVWAGLHKLNPSFFAHGLDAVAEGAPPWANVAAALAEATLGVAMLGSRTQRAAAWLLALFSTATALTLAARGLNRAVIPWNAEHALLFVWLARRPSDALVRLREPLPNRRRVGVVSAVVLVFGVLPIAWLVGYPPYLALRLYTASSMSASLYLDDMERLPASAHSVASLDSSGTYAHVVDLQAWSQAASGAFVPPERATFEAVLGRICVHLPTRANALLVLQRPADFFLPAQTHYLRCPARMRAYLAR